MEKVLLIPENTYTHLKNQILDENQLSTLDKQMLEIIKMKNIDLFEKYQLYRTNLIKHAGISRKNNYSSLVTGIPANFVVKAREGNEFGQNVESNKPHVIKHVSTNATQTKRKFFNEKSTVTDNTNTGETSTQTELLPHQVFKPVEEIFESTNLFDSLKDYEENTDHHISIESSFDESSIDRKKIKSQIKTSDPSYLMYEMEDGSIVTIIKDRNKSNENFQTKKLKTVNKKVVNSTPKRNTSKNKKHSSDNNNQNNWNSLYK